MQQQFALAVEVVTLTLPCVRGIFKFTNEVRIMDWLLTVIQLLIAGTIGCWGAAKFDHWYVGLPIVLAVSFVLNLTVALIFIGFGWVS